METVRIDYSYKLADIPEPRIRTAKEWRRYQVLLKKMRQRIDEQIMRSIYGDNYGCNSAPTSYPPKSGRRWGYLLSIVADQP